MWNGYWWRLVEDNGQQKKPADDNPWIPIGEWGGEKARRGTYVVTVKYGRSFWPELATKREDRLERASITSNLPAGDIVAFYHLESLYTEPVEPKCDDCEYYRCSGVDDEEWSFCMSSEEFVPEYGMTGCFFKRKEGA